MYNPYATGGKNRGDIAAAYVDTDFDELDSLHETERQEMFRHFPRNKGETKVSQNSSAANSLLDAALATDPFDLSGFGEALGAIF